MDLATKLMHSKVVAHSNIKGVGNERALANSAHRRVGTRRGEHARLGEFHGGDIYAMG